MRWLRIVGVAAVTFAIPLASFAKGAAGATLEGEGIDGFLVVDQAGELGQGTAMSLFAERAGFFPLVFGDETGQTAGQTEALVAGETQPTIVVTWDMVGDPIVQDLYFLKDGSVVAYVAPGQEFWEDTAKTVGGWMSIKADLRKPLAELGVDVSVLPRLAVTPPPAPAATVATPAPAPEPAPAVPPADEPAPAAPAPSAPQGGVPAVPVMITALGLGLAAAAVAGARRSLGRRERVLVR